MMALMDGPGFTGPDGKTVFAYAHPLFWAPYTHHRRRRRLSRRAMSLDWSLWAGRGNRFPRRLEML